MAVALVIIAAFFNAIMDRVETTISFNDSVFNKLNPLWWCKDQSANVVKRIPFTNYRPDCWHLNKSAMICAFLAIPFFYKPIIGGFVDYVMLGILYNVVFEQLYSRVLRKK